MPNLYTCTEKVQDASLISHIVDSAKTQNCRQMEIASRLGALLEQLRGCAPTSGGCGAPTPEISGALHVLGEAVDHHRDLNDRVLDQIVELEQLLAY